MTPSFEQFSGLSNKSLIAAGALLFIMQMHGFLHTVQPDSFGFSSDNHYHEHQKWDQEKASRQSNTHESIF
jgi:hypothetical protein